MPTEVFESNQTYIENTNVMTTQFITQTGTSLLTDLMPVRAPNSYDLWPDEEILRILKMETGFGDFFLELLLRGDYGRQDVQLRKLGNWGIEGHSGRKHFHFQASRKLKIELKNTRFGQLAFSRFKLSPGEEVFLSLSYADEAPAVIPSLETATHRLEQSIQYWQGWSSLSTYQGQYEKLVTRSALALKLNNFAPSGAFIAAPTTSLPEQLGGSRNWDYRFCWIRDASFTTRALIRLGYTDEAKSFLNWLLHSTRLTWPHLQVLYSVYGEARITEKSVPDLTGFRNSKPVRIGNDAASQMQLDIYGEVIDAFYSSVDLLYSIDSETRKMIIGFGKSVAELWREPGQGIWEFRSKAEHHTHGKVMCWVAMDRLTKLSQRFGWALPYDAMTLAYEIRESIETSGFNPQLQSYTRTFEGSELDASLLIMPLVGYCDPKDPRYRSTQQAIISQLSRNDLIYRYQPGSDGILESEGSFTICNFWLAEAFAKAGNLSEAQRWFNGVVRHLAPSGLISEEMDPTNGEYLGNHPQGFSHIGLINAALAIDDLQKIQNAEERKSA